MEPTDVVINATPMKVACEMGNTFTMVWADDHCELGGGLNGWLHDPSTVNGESLSSGHGGNNTNNFAGPRSISRGLLYAQSLPGGGR